MYAHEMIFGTFGIHQLTNARLCKGLQQLKMRNKRSSNAEQQFFPPLVWAEFCGMSRLFFFFLSMTRIKCDYALLKLNESQISDFLWLQGTKKSQPAHRWNHTVPRVYLDEDRLFFWAKSNQR